MAVLAAIIIALLTGLAGKAKEWLFPTKVTVTGTVLLGGQPSEGVKLTLDDDPVEPTDEEGRFALENVRKGKHTLVLRKLGAWPRKPYTFKVGGDDKKLGRLSLERFVNVGFVYDQGNPGPTVDYTLYAWLIGRPAAMKLVKSVVYELPVWVGRPPVSGTARQPFCYSLTDSVDFGFLGQHGLDPVNATVVLRNGQHFKVPGLPPNLPGVAQPGNCPEPPAPVGSGGGSGGGGSGGGGGGSGGGATKRVPDVIDQSFESASSRLQSAGFTVALVEVESDKAPGIVVAQSPQGGTSQPPGTKITLSVSKGPTKVVTVPDVTGHSPGDAATKLEDNNFKVRVVPKITTDPAQDGIVLSQDPPGGTQAKSGSTVTIVVGKLSP